MGAWSHEPFGNDDACDWAYGLSDTNDLSFIESAINRVLEADDYIEAPDASEAIAAIEVMAKLLGKGTQMDSYTSEVDAWVSAVSIKPGLELLSKAKNAIDLILADNSELFELWQESGSDDWVKSVKKLQIAVGA
jgi:hypothetical protein